MNAGSEQECGNGFQTRLTAARLGSVEELGQLFQMARRYLLAVANQELEWELQAKAGASDLIQETFLEAQLKFGAFQGCSAEQLLGWLRGILLNKLAELDRRYRWTDKRRIDRECSLDPNCSGDPGLGIPSEETSPSGVVARDEQAARLQGAVARLPDHYRQVIVWREWEDLSLEEIGARLGRSKVAARMLWARAIERLQHELKQSDERS